MVSFALSILLFSSYIVFLIVFSCLCILVVHKISLRRWFWIHCQFIDLHFFKINYQGFINFLWWCHIYLFFVILDSLYWYLHIWAIRFLFQTYRFALAETDLYQCGSLVMSAYNVLGHVGSATMVYFGVRQLLELWGWGCRVVPLAENSWIGLLTWFLTTRCPAQLPGFSGQAY